MLTVMRDAAAQITDANNAITLTSFISQFAPGGGTRVPQAIAGRVLPYHIGRIPADNRNTLVVQFLSAYELTV
jgi:hypothetical protein